MCDSLLISFSLSKVFAAQKLLLLVNINTTGSSLLNSSQWRCCEGPGVLYGSISFDLVQSYAVLRLSVLELFLDYLSDAADWSCGGCSRAESGHFLRHHKH